MSPHPGLPRTRLFVDDAFAQGASLTLDAKLSHYLHDVLRLREGEPVALFNGRDGEWLAQIESASKKAVTLALVEVLRPQAPAADIWLCFAPLKAGKSEWVVEKATELGASRFCPVKTRHTVADKVNDTRLSTIALEAAEQCERMDVPAVDALVTFDTMLASWPVNRTLVVADESGAGHNARELVTHLGQGTLALLIGPEGGFSMQELEMLRQLPYVKGMSLGPRILRADTAALAALTLLVSAGPGWDGKPAFRQLKD